MLKPLSARPDDASDPVISQTLRSEGERPKVVWILVSETRDAIREYDGREWRIVKDKRKQPLEDTLFYPRPARKTREHRATAH